MARRPFLRPVAAADNRRPAAFEGAFSAIALILPAFILLTVIGLVAGTNADSLRQTLFDPEVIAAMRLTFSAALAATFIALLTGVPLAYLLARFTFPGKFWVEGLITLPIVVPHTAAGIALLMALGRQSIIGKLFGGVGIRFVDSPAGITAAMLFVSLPFLVNTAREAFALVDVDLERVAETEGANRAQTFFLITLPLAWRGVLAGAVLMWGRGISEFGAVAILAYHPKIMPVLVFERFIGFGLSAAQPAAVILISASLLVFVALQLLLKQNQ